LPRGIEHTNKALNGDRHPNRKGTAPAIKKAGLKGWGNLEDSKSIGTDEALRGEVPNSVLDERDPNYIAPEEAAEDERLAEEEEGEYYDEELAKIPGGEIGDFHPEVNKVSLI